MTDVPSGGPGESKGVAFTNWFVMKAAGLLERKSSRRGFLIGSAMVGSAVAVAGCAPGTQPGSPYSHITDCARRRSAPTATPSSAAPSTSGLNTCPPGSFVGGWWRADLLQLLQRHPLLHRLHAELLRARPRQRVLRRVHRVPLREVAATRARIYCNYFRYGQCHQEIGITGPIACRVVTCVPPYLIAELRVQPRPPRSTTPLPSTRPRTAARRRPPPPPPVLPVTVGVSSPEAGKLAMFYRGAGGNIFGFLSTGGASFQGGQLGPAVTSAVTSASDASGIYAFGRGFGDALWYNRLANDAWSGPQDFGGVPLTSDPVAVTAPNAIYLFGRSQNNQLWHGHIDSGVWSGWYPMQGNLTSDVAAVSSNYGLHVFARQVDGQLWTRLLSGGAWSPWTPLGGSPKATPTAVVTAAGVNVFILNADGALWTRRYNGSWGAWSTLGGAVDGHAVVGGRRRRQRVPRRTRHQRTRSSATS